MLPQVSSLLDNLLSIVSYGFTFLTESVFELCGYSCKLTKAEVEGYTDLSFRLNNVPYCIRFKRKFGPASYTRIEKEDGESVIKEVSEFAGPCRNFYGIPTTPYMLGFESLKIFYRSAEVKTFSENELIILEK